jgi:hypothetical protein
MTLTRTLLEHLGNPGKTMRQPSLMAATAALSVSALFFSLGGAGWAANGGAFILGMFNSATQGTGLGANYNGTALALSNTSAGAAATALTLSVAVGHPPMKVNTVTKVTNLNADYLDGIDSTKLARVQNIPFNLAAGAVSAPIAIPANRPVQVVGVVIGDVDPGAGQASLLRNSGASPSLVWVALNAYPSASIATQGFSSIAGTKIVGIGYNSAVTVDVASSETIRVHNLASFPVTGSVSLIW